MKNKPYKIEIKEVVDDYVVMSVYENEHKSYPTKRIVIKPYDVYMENDKLKEEIERLNGALQTHEILLKSNVLEIERLENIIKEVREYIENDMKLKDNFMIDEDGAKYLLEILDKAEE